MIITQTPLRISFFGGNTDFPSFFKKYGGCVLSTAIDKYIYCIITKRFDKKIYINWSKKEIVDSVDKIEHNLVREAMWKVGIKEGVEISFLADIPSEGSGLGSSSSVLVGVLNALYHYKGISPSAEQLAKEAVEIEIDILKKPIGIQDQYVAAFGGLRCFEFQPDGQVICPTIELERHLLEDLDNHLMLFYTGHTRKSESILQHVQACIDEKTELLLKAKEMVNKGQLFLKKGDTKKFGKLLNEGWLLKKNLSNSISNLEIDSMYQTAIKAGALGGKIAGAGGGGFLLLVVPSQKRASVRNVLSKYQEMPFRLEKDGSKVIFNVRKY